jgi:hypothetical protein
MFSVISQLLLPCIFIDNHMIILKKRSKKNINFILLNKLIN